MPFMDAVLTGKCEWAEIVTDNGTWFLPADMANFRGREGRKNAVPYVDGKIQSIRILKGYGVRLSADGYMDCTEWDFYSNLRDAKRAHRELMEECEDES